MILRPNSGVGFRSCNKRIETVVDEVIEEGIVTVPIETEEFPITFKNYFCKEFSLLVSPFSYKCLFNLKDSGLQNMYSRITKDIFDVSHPSYDRRNL